MMRLDLAAAVRESRNLVLTNADRLEAWVTGQPHRKLPRAINSMAVLEWLTQVEIFESNHYGDLRADKSAGARGSSRYATAYYTAQEVRVNTSFLTCGEFTQEDLEDLVLHELGHLFTSHFLGTRGHGCDWQWLGWILGYVPLGSTSIERRRWIRDNDMLTYRMAAAAGTPHPQLGV